VSTLHGVVAHFDFDPPPSIGTTSVDFESITSIGLSAKAVMNLCNLLALASATEVASNRLQPELQIEALLAFCRENLHDPELSAQLVADRIGISVRTLHLRFKEIGQTPAQVTPALSYARVMLGHALRTGKASDIEKARAELTKAFRAAGWTYRPRGRPRSMRHTPDDGEPE
jgi:AraC-like DNA-binding protein